MKKFLCTPLALAFFSTFCACTLFATQPAPQNLAEGKDATASGNENNIFVPAKAVDGKVDREKENRDQSRWCSDVKNFKGGTWVAPKAEDAIWFQVDLGKIEKNICEVVLEWEVVKVLDYKIEVSTDGTTWSTAWTSKGKKAFGLREQIRLDAPQTARYVRLTITKFERGGWAAVSLFEFQVYNGYLPENVHSVASRFSEKNIDLSKDKITYNIPEGMTASVVASTLKPLIAMDGTITRPICPKDNIEVTFNITDGKDTVQTPTLKLSLKPILEKKSENAMPKIIPALQEWVGGKGKFIRKIDTKDPMRIIIRKEDAQKGTPTLEARMQVFAKEMAPAKVIMGTADDVMPGDIFVSLETAGLPSLGKEGYVMGVLPLHVFISANDPIGAFWATRTLLQGFDQNDNTFPCGAIRDYPRYEVRGFMFDVGRKPVSLGMIRDVLKMMAYYKLNDYQLHLNDNFIWLQNYTKINTKDKNCTPEDLQKACDEVLAAAGGAFRLESKCVGKNGVALTSKVLSYTKKEFGELLDEGRLYGVNVVPEIDVPGHALSFVAVRPELMYKGDVSHHHGVERTAMLNASDDIYDTATNRTYREETLAFVQSVFDEYLRPQNGEQPVFRNGVVHIGTDEYYGNNEDYRAFADAMLRYVKSTGFTPRLWGSLRRKPGKTPVLTKGIQVHIWSRDWQMPQPSIDDGSPIINILDHHAYIVPNGSGNIGAYCDMINIQNNYSQNWHPHIFANHKVLPGHPLLLGAQFAVWNDHSFIGDCAVGDFDLFDRIQKCCAVYAEKTWNDGTSLTYPEFEALLKAIDVPNDIDPRCQKLTQKVITWATGKEEKITEAQAFCVADMAPNYTMEITVKRTGDSKGEQILFSSAYGQSFKAVQNETGRVGLSTNGWDYSFDYTLPVDQFVTLKLVTKGRQATLFADGKKIGDAIRNLYPQNRKTYTFVFPLTNLGDIRNQHNFKGVIKDFKITRNP